MIGIFFTARLGSTRLSNKHLIEVAGFSFLEWMIKRFQYAFKDEINRKEAGLFIVTSVKEENKKFELYARKLGIEVYYGSDDNIPLRHLQCAEDKHLNHIISIDGDDILCSAMAAKDIYLEVKKDDAIKAMKTVGLPLGMNVFSYSTSYLKNCLENASTHKLETGWGRIFGADDFKVLNYEGFTDYSDFRMTLDYEDDARFFSSVIENQKEKIISIDDKSLLYNIKKNEWFKINQHLNDEYWVNFNSEKKQEDTL